MSQPLGGPAPGAPTPPAPQPAPGAPGTPPAPSAPGAPQPAPAGTPPEQDPNTPVDVAGLPPNVQRLIADLRRENGAHRQGRTTAEQTAAAAQQQRDAVLKALGLNPDGTAAADPEAAAAALTQRAAEAEAAAWGAATKLVVFQAAAGLGANPDALLDSNSFIDSLDEIADGDPGSAEFRTALEAKIRDAVARNPVLRAIPTGQGPARMGAEHTGSGNTGGQRVQGLGAAVAAAYRK